ncbi:MAG: HAD-IA family hydrolase [Pseudomonadota bacterium]
MRSVPNDKGIGDTDLEGTSVIFDLDGTLIDTATDLAASMNHAIAADGLAALDVSAVRHLVGHGARRMLSEAYQLAGCEADGDMLDRSLDRFLDYYYGNIADHSRPFPRVEEEIGVLRRAGARVAICTNKREAPAVKLIETLGLSFLFDVIVGADSTAAAKPDPAPVRRCLDVTGARRAVFVGDSDTDIRAADNIGLPCVAVRFGYGPLTLKDQAVLVIDTYAGFAARVDELAHAPARVV